MIRRRFQLFEFGDQAYLPEAVRRVYHDCLGFVSRACGFYDRMYVPFSTWTKDSHEQAVLDLASGAAGPIETMLGRAKENNVKLPKIVLSDLYPNEEQFETLRNRFGSEHVAFMKAPVSVTDASTEGYPLLSICAAFHHFPPEVAQSIIAQSINKGRGIFIVEPFERKFSTVLTTALIGPLLGFASPFFRFPWRARNFLLCSIFPVVPLMVAFDGIISVLRSYSSDELQAMLPKERLDQLRVRSGRLPTRIRQPATFFYAIRR